MLSEHSVKGYSMYPLLRPGQRVVLDLYKTQFSKGDVVAFFVNQELVVLHRVMAIDGKFLICKGDSNGFSDKPVNIEAVYGVLDMVRLSAEKWHPAAAYQKPFFLSNTYSVYAQFRKTILFFAYRIKRLISF
jgi:hypothetical protein